MTSFNRRGVTMIEVLIVVGVIAILAGLLLPAISMLRRQARGLRTATQIEAVTSALQRAATERDLMAMLSVRGPAQGIPFPPPPPARKAYRPGTTYRTSIDTANVEAVSLREFDPSPAPLLLHWSGLLPKRPVASDRVADSAVLAANLAAYNDHIDPDSAWIDAWGRPLVVACLTWQAHLRVGTLNNGGAYTVALNDIQGRRSYGLWVAVASAGRTGVPTASAPDALRAAIWAAANERCDPDGSWRVDAGRAGDGVNAVLEPPWQGVRTARGTTALLSAPVELQ